MKPALLEAAEGARKRGRALAEQALSLQERLDAAAHLLTQRSQDQSTIAAQVRTYTQYPPSLLMCLAAGVPG